MVNPTELETLNAPQLRELTRELVERLSEQQYENAETIASLKRELLFKSTRIEQPSYELPRCKRLRFARTSEKLDAVQASLLEEALDSDLAAIEQQLEQLREQPKSAARLKPCREALPAHLPRVPCAVHHEPESRSCGCALAHRRRHLREARL